MYRQAYQRKRQKKWIYRAREAFRLTDILKRPCERRASDVHIKVGSPPVLRIDGKLTPMLEQKRLTQEDVVKLAFSMMNQTQREKFKSEERGGFRVRRPRAGRGSG